MYAPYTKYCVASLLVIAVFMLIMTFSQFLPEQVIDAVRIVNMVWFLPTALWLRYKADAAGMPGMKVHC